MLKNHLGSDPRVQVIYRSSLERQMPDAKAVFAKLFSTLQLTEPQFKSVVVLFRNKVLTPVQSPCRLCSAAN